MGIGEDFSNFCNNLTINNRRDISLKYKNITKRLNQDFWDSDSEINHSLYVGSYGRDTAIRGFSDLDMLFILPPNLFIRYDNYRFNGQSKLLQDVRNSIRKRYPLTRMLGADGQVVIVPLSGGIVFEVVPCFENTDGSFTFADTNRGGCWKITNPRPEIESIREMDKLCNGNLKWLCRMARAWKNKWNVSMGGLLIDTLAHRFLNDWEYNKQSFYYYDWMSRDFFLYLSNQQNNQQYWLAVGSNQYIKRKGIFNFKAKQCYNLALGAINYEAKNSVRSARLKWRLIYGPSYPI